MMEPRTAAYARMQVPNPSCPVRAAAYGFNITYGSSLLAELAQDSLSLAYDVVPGYTFGCVQKAAGPSALPQGLLGLGRGPLFFLSQTKNLYSSTFSYCLPSFKSLNFSGTLRLGPAGQPKTIKTTPLHASPRRSSSLDLGSPMASDSDQRFPNRKRRVSPLL